MLRDDEVAQNLRPWAGLVAGLSLFSIVWILKPSRSMPAWKALASGILGLALVAVSNILFVSGYNATMVGGVSTAIALSSWLLTYVVILWIGGNGTGLRSARNTIALSTLALVPLLLCLFPIISVFAVRGPVPIYWLMVSALDQRWARWTLFAIGASLLIVGNSPAAL
jgi:hypothetical protein